MALNKVLLMGNVGGTPEMRYTASGKPVTVFSLACNRTYKDHTGEKKTKTNWFRISSFGKLAEFCNQYIEKGKKIFVEGSININNYTDTNGTSRTQVEIVAEKVEFLSPSTQQQNRQPSDELEPESINFDGTDAEAEIF